MNKKWIVDSYRSAELYRLGRYEPNNKLRLIRTLDAIGLFETSWLIYDHSRNILRYRYPK